MSVTSRSGVSVADIPLDWVALAFASGAKANMTASDPHITQRSILAI